MKRQPNYLAGLLKCIFLEKVFEEHSRQLLALSDWKPAPCPRGFPLRYQIYPLPFCTDWESCALSHFSKAQTRSWQCYISNSIAVLTRGATYYEVLNLSKLILFLWNELPLILSTLKDSYICVLYKDWAMYWHVGHSINGGKNHRFLFIISSNSLYGV